MMAAQIGVKELMLSEDEAKKLSDALLRVNDLYGGFIIPEKVLAWVGLATTGVAIYGPRFASYKIRVAQEAKKQKDSALNVAPIQVI